VGSSYDHEVTTNSVVPIIFKVQHYSDDCSICRLLRKLRPDFLEVQPLLNNTLKILGDLSTPMAAAIAVECLITMLELCGAPSEELVATTMSIVGQLLANKNSNLRYVI